MEKETTARVFFSLSSAPSSRPNPSALQTSSQPFPHRGSVAADATAAIISSDAGPGDETEDGVAKAQFITVFDASQTLATSDDAKPIIIPPVPNAKMKNLLPVPTSNEDYKRWKFREDMKELPQDLGQAEFKDMKVEDFPIAYLAGYGWSKGQVIGRNKMVPDPKVVEYKRRGGTEGLGYRSRNGRSLTQQEKEHNGSPCLSIQD